MPTLTFLVLTALKEQYAGYKVPNTSFTLTYTRWNMVEVLGTTAGLVGTSDDYHW